MRLPNVRASQKGRDLFLLTLAPCLQRKRQRRINQRLVIVDISFWRKVLVSDK